MEICLIKIDFSISSLRTSFILIQTIHMVITASARINSRLLTHQHLCLFCNLLSPLFPPFSLSFNKIDSAFKYIIIGFYLQKKFKLRSKHQIPQQRKKRQRNRHQKKEIKATNLVQIKSPKIRRNQTQMERLEPTRSESVSHRSKLSNLRKNSISTNISQELDELKYLMHCISQSRKSKFGFRIAE